MLEFVRETTNEGEKTVETAAAAATAAQILALGPTVKVGDLFYDSWGYDQTQVDFYEVVGLTPSGKSVRVQKVRQENVTDEGPTVQVKPVKGTNYGPVETKRLRDASWGSEVKYAFRVNSFSSAYQDDWDTTWTVTGWGYGH
jgi:hypothetical protein